MLRGSVLLRGLLYALLMFIAKALVSSVVYVDYFVGTRWQKKPASQVQSSRQAASNSDTAIGILTSPGLQSGPPHTVALLMGFAMIARGEIGFLIASLSQSSGTLTLRSRDGRDVTTSNDDIFLVILWAVVLCTITGPLGVGVTVKKLKYGFKASCIRWL